MPALPAFRPTGVLIGEPVEAPDAELVLVVPLVFFGARGVDGALTAALGVVVLPPLPLLLVAKLLLLRFDGVAALVRLLEFPELERLEWRKY